MFKALYRERRPEVFGEILGQEHIVKILRHQIETDTISHAYLFCGTRGTGKTTTARILAKAVNCLSDGERPCGECPNCKAIKDGTFMDVIEIDAASNNGVDNIRELRESVKYPPSVGRKKIYIIDEVHMLSTGAFNALLKTLEEPPENVMFILCTTEPQKLPQTILSRCMRLDFKRVPQNVLKENMKKICSEKGVEISDGAVSLLSNSADGSVRDGLSILDQVLAAGDKKIDRDDVLEYIGTVGEEFFIELTDLVSLKKVSEALLLLNSVLLQGKDPKQLMKDWNEHYRNLLITKFMKNPEDLLNMSQENIEKIKEQSGHISLEEINEAIVRLSKTINDSRYSTQPRILLELDIVAIATGFKGGDRSFGQSPQIEKASARVERVNPKIEKMESSVQRQQAETVSPKVEKASLKTENVSPQAEKASHSVNKSEDWNDILDSLEEGAESMNVLRGGTTVIDVNDSRVKLAARNKIALSYFESNRSKVEKAIRNKYGENVIIDIEVNNKPFIKENKVTTDEEMARMAMDELGIELKVED